MSSHPDLGLPERSGPDDVVVVLGAGPRRGETVLRGTDWETAHRVVLPSRRLDELHERIARLPRVDLVLDLGSSWGPGQLRRWRRLSPHLREGGWWVAVRTPRPAGPPEQRELLVNAHAATDDAVVRVRQDRQHLLKAVPDSEADHVLATREPLLTNELVTTLPGGVLHSPGTCTDHGAARGRALPADVPYPAAHLRRYSGNVLLYRSGVAVTGRTVLPDSFRWHQSAHPENAGLNDQGPHFARLRRGRARGDVTRLAAPHYYLDYTSSGHFGHFMTEALARLWGWEAARQEEPGLRLLLRDHPRRPRATRLEHAMLPALSIDPGEVTWVAGVVQAEHLYSATPLWHNAPPHYVHPQMRDLWRRMDAYWRDRHPISEEPTADRIFITRREGFRRCRNVEEVEALFTAHGYEIVRPGLLPPAEQAAVFRSASVVAGFGGSGMFNLMYASDRLRALVVLNHASYDAYNEHLYAAALGVDSHFFWSEADVGRPADGTSYRARQSRWDFDFEVNAMLPEVLDSLG